MLELKLQSRRAVGAGRVVGARTRRARRRARPGPGRRVRPRDVAATPGVVWQGHERLGVTQVAGLLAPALWFSTDEPLLTDEHPPIPTAHPCDRAASGAIVYYQVTELTYRGEAPVSRPEQDDDAFADKVESFILKYYFYYPEDSGVGGHTHDLETAEFEVWLEGNDSCRRVRLASVEAQAHGSRWYSNTLKIRADAKYPMTLLVEEGKHATAPDRNADGSFMRGYDVTERVNDAWGVRDSLGQGVLLSSGYSLEMTKRRTEPFRLLPPESPYLQVTARQRSYSDGQPSLGRYELRPANIDCEVRRDPRGPGPPDRDDGGPSVRRRRATDAGQSGQRRPCALGADAPGRVAVGQSSRHQSEAWRGANLQGPGPARGSGSFRVSPSAGRTRRARSCSRPRPLDGRTTTCPAAHAGST